MADDRVSRSAAVDVCSGAARRADGSRSVPQVRVDDAVLAGVKIVAAMLRARKRAARSHMVAQLCSSRSVGSLFGWRLRTPPGMRQAAWIVGMAARSALRFAARFNTPRPPQLFPAHTPPHRFHRFQTFGALSACLFRSTDVSQDQRCKQLCRRDSLHPAVRR